MVETDEKMIYQKLFDIRYKNKYFTVFIDKYNRKTFLEIDKNGEYIYPYIDDFIELHKIYNERDKTVMYDSKDNKPMIHKLSERHNAKGYTFKEMVRTFTGLVALSVAVTSSAYLIAGALTGTEYKLSYKDNELKVIIDYVDDTVITNTSELDAILGYTRVTKEEVLSAIELNEDIPDKYKVYAINLVEYMTSQYPNTDLRIFYDNVKTLKIIEASEKTMGETVAGTYSCSKNLITIKEGYTEDTEVITHEFAHAYHSWKEKNSFSPKCRIESIGDSLNEAMTNKVISGLVSTTTYSREGKVLDYLLTCVDYDYYDYETEGITKLISLLNEKYPEVDINYIITSLDSMHDTEVKTEEYISLTSDSNLLDELFNLCIYNIDMDEEDIYAPLKNFTKTINFTYNNIGDNYLKKYNDIIISNGYDKNNIIEDCQIIAGFKSENSFDNFLSKLKIEDISDDNIYGAFKNFLDNIPTESYIFKKYFGLYYWLDQYNEFLYQNGYTSDDIRTSEEISAYIDKYERVIGYVTVKDYIYPLLEKNSDNTEFKIIDENGNVKTIYDSEIILYQIVAINISCSKIFTKALTYNENLIGTNAFWQSIYDIEPIVYEKALICNNGRQIIEDYINDIDVEIEQTEDGKVVFTLIDKEEQVIYQSENNNQTKGYGYTVIPLKEYLNVYMHYNRNNNLKKVELSKILTENYLKYAVAGLKLSKSVGNYSTITYDVENDILKFHPTYYIIDSENQTKKILNDYFLITDNQSTIILGNGERINIPSSYISSYDRGIIIYLETAMDYYGVLSVDTQDYCLSHDEIVELFTNYLNDVYNKDNSKSR